METVLEINPAQVGPKFAMHQAEPINRAEIVLGCSDKHWFAHDTTKGFIVPIIPPKQVRNITVFQGGIEDCSKKL